MNGFLIGNPFILLTKNLKYKKIIFDNTSIIYKEVLIHMKKKEKLNIVNGKNSITVKFLDYIAEVTINGQQMITGYQQNLNLNEVTQKLTAAIIQEEEKSKKPFYNEIFPAFGREFKILVSNILKARV